MPQAGQPAVCRAPSAAQKPPVFTGDWCLSPICTALKPRGLSQTCSPFPSSYLYPLARGFKPASQKACAPSQVPKPNHILNLHVERGSHSTPHIWDRVSHFSVGGVLGFTLVWAQELSSQKESIPVGAAALRVPLWIELHMPCCSTLAPQNSFCSLTLETRECSMQGQWEESRYM